MVEVSHHASHAYRGHESDNALPSLTAYCLWCVDVHTPPSAGKLALHAVAIVQLSERVYGRSYQRVSTLVRWINHVPFSHVQRMNAVAHGV